MEQRSKRVSRLLIALAMAMCSLGLLASATSRAQSSSSETEQMVQRCQKAWVPECTRYGVEDPKKQSETPPSEIECAIAWRPGCPGEAEAVQSLVRAGPSTDTYPNPQQFSARGFIQNGWPVVIKYRAPVGAIPTLTVKPLFGGGATFTHALPRSDGTDRLYSFPAAFSGSDGKVVVADYAITARDASNAAVPVMILGFGAGPRAVGSIAIDQIRSDPPTVQRPSGKDVTLLTFSYLLENDWDLVSEDLWRVCKGIFCNFSHPRNPYHPAGRGPQKWEWQVNRKAKTGQYQLVIRAWHQCGAAVNVDSYHQCGNQLDWVIGSAGPVFIQ
jgi:hypothetical protein